MSKKEIKVIAFGTFDIFHKGHESFLKQAKKSGKYLIVVVARDANVKKAKGARPKHREQFRLKQVKACGLADKVVLGNLRKRFGMIKKWRPDMIAVGYDQVVNLPELRDKLLKYGLENVTIKKMRAYRPEIYKSSKLK